MISAFGMSACFYTTEKMLNNSTGQVLPITAGQVGVAAFISTIWCMVDRWASDTWTGSYELPASLFQQSNLPATLSILWTGLVATDLNFLLETTALETVSSPEAAVILSTEPLWVALFSYPLLRETFNANDLIGGSLVIAACFVSALENVNDKSINDGTNDDNDNQEPDVEETCEIEQDGFMISRVTVVGVRCSSCIVDGKCFC